MTWFGKVDHVGFKMHVVRGKDVQDVFGGGKHEHSPRHDFLVK